MSLVGSLEDLGLAEILQIVGLSGKSGVLCVRSDEGEGRIALQKGSVRGASLQDAPSDLRGLLASEKALPGPDLAALVAEARKRGRDLEAVVLERGALDADALEGLRRRHVEACLRRMFRWSTGDFTFEVNEGRAPEGELVLSGGLSAQFVALECARLNDEEGASGPDPFAALDAHAAAAASGGTPEPIDVAVHAEGGSQTGPVESAVPARDVEDCPVVVVDRELAVLEWAKSVLAARHGRVHIFQRSELGVARIRQYLARGELPCVILASDAPADVLSGTEDGLGLARRLRAQAPRMPILLLVEEGRDACAELPAGITTVTKPAVAGLGELRSAPAREACGAALCRVVAAATGKSVRTSAEPERTAAAAEPPAAAPVPAALRTLLDRAAQEFERVAIFWVSDDEAVGLAQSGLPAAGGPDECELRQVRVPLRDPAWFRAALENERGVRRGPDGEGDRRLAAHLGEVIAPEAWVAPVTTEGRIVALLYADNLPTAEPLIETEDLQNALREAGRALEPTSKARPSSD